jgi:hypothetical protein
MYEITRNLFEQTLKKPNPEKTERRAKKEEKERREEKEREKDREKKEDKDSIKLETNYFSKNKYVVPKPNTKHKNFVHTRDELYLDKLYKGTDPNKKTAKDTLLLPLIKNEM